mgnify:CR=1 FL=1
MSVDSAVHAPTTDLHIISALVENHFGVLARISAMFAARSFNIDSLTVGPTQDPTASRMTVSVKGEAAIVDQIRKQLNKLPEVITVDDLTESGVYVERELVLVKVGTDKGDKQQLIELIDEFRPLIADLTDDSLTIQVVATQMNVERLLDLLEPYGILEVGRTGVVALKKGGAGLHQTFAMS